jgi:hypothetical protein
MKHKVAMKFLKISTVILLNHEAILILNNLLSSVTFASPPWLSEGHKNIRA